MRKEAGRETILCLSDWRRSTGFFPLGGFLVVPALRLLGLDLALFPFFLSFFFFVGREDGRASCDIIAPCWWSFLLVLVEKNTFGGAQSMMQDVRAQQRSRHNGG